MPVGFTSSFYRFQISALRDTVVERTVCPADDICNAGSIEEKLRPRTKSSKEENRKSSPAAQLGRKSKFHSAHVTPNHLEILNAKFYYLATSNLGD